MNWRCNIIGGEAEHIFQPRFIGEAAKSDYALYYLEQGTLTCCGLPFNAEGETGQPFIVPGRRMAAYDGGVIGFGGPESPELLTGLNHKGEKKWEGDLSCRNSLRVSLVSGENKDLFLLYTACNPHDLHQEAKLARLDADNGHPEDFFTFPDADFFQTQLLLYAGNNRLLAFVRNRGAAVMIYTLDTSGGIISSAPFVSHPHFRWAVPLCGLDLGGGEILLGGFRSPTLNTRLPWLALCHVEMGLMWGRTFTPEESKGAFGIAELSRSADGGLAALMPPGQILNLNPGGEELDRWLMPAEKGGAARPMSTVRAVPGGCLVAGNTISGPVNVPKSAWLARMSWTKERETAA